MVCIGQDLEIELDWRLAYTMLLVLFVSWFHSLCCLLTLFALTRGILFLLVLTESLLIFLVALITFTVINTLPLLLFSSPLNLLDCLSDTPNYLPRLVNLGIYDDAVFAFALYLP